MSKAGIHYPAKMPELPLSLEWMVHAEASRFTVTLCHKVPHNTEATESTEDARAGYIMHHTHNHDVVISQKDWEERVCNAAASLLLRYREGNNHAKWADELLRRSR